MQLLDEHSNSYLPSLKLLCSYHIKYALFKKDLVKMSVESRTCDWMSVWSVRREVDTDVGRTRLQRTLFSSQLSLSAHEVQLLSSLCSVTFLSDLFIIGIPFHLDMWLRECDCVGSLRFAGCVGHVPYVLYIP